MTQGVLCLLALTTPKAKAWQGHRNPERDKFSGPESRPKPA